ncbi:MAG: polymorphic toxin type 23 domain-containing protein [Chitinophagales bacterium]
MNLIPANSTKDYDPFGMGMPNRSWSVSSSENYRYGFNGQEQDDEVYGNGNANTAMFWEYDPRLGRRWNVDPIDKPWLSKYHAFSNKPITNTDSNGDCDDCPQPSFKIGLSLGTGGLKVGTSFTLDQPIGDFTASYGLGVTYQSNFYTTGKSGIEFRNSAMMNYNDGDFSVSVGTNMWSGTGQLQEFSQRTGMMAASFKGFGFIYENDGTPFGYVGLGDREDSYRTAAASITIREFSVNMNLLTGLRDKESFAEEEKAADGKMGTPQGEGMFGENYTHGFVYEKGEKYRYGGLTLNYGEYSIGINSDRWIRGPFQNTVAHDWIQDQRQFQVLSNAILPVINISNISTTKFTIWL